MALYAFDGTGNEDEEHDTNVLEFFRAVEGGDPDFDAESGALYVPGVGTGQGKRLKRLFEKAFGIGAGDRVDAALARLERNVRDGDRTIDVVGFSRGAAQALDFANEVADDFPDLRIRFMGLWDTVAQVGLPGMDVGIDLDAPPNADHIYHALALDETRFLFPLTRITKRSRPDVRIVEAWFAGVHSDVGGGNGNDGLNWFSLHWMFTNALRHDLAVDPAAIERNKARRVEQPRVGHHEIDLDRRRKVRENDFVHESVGLVPAPSDRREFRGATVRLNDEGETFA